jgi:hypothetical protein
MNTKRKKKHQPPASENKKNTIHSQTHTALVATKNTPATKP